MHRTAGCFFFFFFNLGMHIPGNLTGKGAYDIYQTTGGKSGSEASWWMTEAE